MRPQCPSLLHMGQIPCSLFLLSPSVSRPNLYHIIPLPASPAHSSSIRLSFSWFLIKLLYKVNESLTRRSCHILPLHVNISLISIFLILIYSILPPQILHEPHFQFLFNSAHIVPLPSSPLLLFCPRASPNGFVSSVSQQS